MKKTRFFMAFLLIVTLLAFTGCANDNGTDMGTNDNGTNGTNPVENGIDDVENGVKNGVDDMTNNNDGVINNNTTNGGINDNMNDVAK